MDTREKWNRRFADSHTFPIAADVLAQNLHLLPQSARALDLASGRGGNALLLAQRGFEVDAVDISDVALGILDSLAREQGLDINTIQRDIESESLPARDYDIIVCSHYLHRPLCRTIAERIRPGGLLYYQTFVADKLDNSGPGSADFLLQKNELLDLFRGLELVYYREDARNGNLSLGSRNTASFVGKKAN